MKAIFAEKKLPRYHQGEFWVNAYKDGSYGMPWRSRENAEGIVFKQQPEIRPVYRIRVTFH